MIRLQGSLLLVLIAMFLCNDKMHAQAPNAAFRNLTAVDGLPETSISAITQDVYGLIWISTWDGVFRYDGSSFTKISSLDSRDIKADKLGGVWISTSVMHRLLYYNTTADSIKTYNIPHGGRSIETTIDDEGNVWAGTEHGIYKLDSASDSFIQEIKQFDNPIYRIASRGNGELFFTFWDKENKKMILGYRLGDGSYQYEDFPLDGNNPVQGKTFIAKYPPFGLALMDSGYIMFNHYGWAFKEKPEATWEFDKLANNETVEDFNGLVIDANGNAWLNQLNTIQKINPQTGSTIIYRQNDSNNNSLLSRSGLGSGSPLFIDRQGVLWIPRFGSGVSRLNLYESDFGLIRDDAGEVILDILSALELSDGSFLIGARTMNNGLYHFDEDKNILRRYGSNSIKSPPGKTISNQLSHPFPWCLHNADSGFVWVGTGWPVQSDGGLNQLKPGSDVITRYKHDSTDVHSIPDNWIRRIIQRKDGKLWALTTYSGWFLFDPQEEMSYTPLINPDSIKWWHVNGIVTNSGDLIYEGQGQYILVNGETMESQQLTINLGDIESIEFAALDDLENVWFVCEQGFGYLDNQFENIEWFFDIRRNKLPAREIKTLDFDHTGQLWLGTDNGLIRFNTASYNYIHYGIERGLQGNAFERKAYEKGASGRLYLGGNGGINVFDPEEILLNPFAPDMVFTGLQLDGEEVKPGKGSALEKPIIVADKITVGSEVSVMTVNFSAIHFAGNSYNQHQYRLEGFDKVWRDGGKVGIATYTNLAPGKYTLYIRGMNWDGVWSDGKKSISIRILPPWYRTWWAYTLYGLIFLFALRLFFRDQKKRTIRKEREKTQQRELEQAKEIEKAYHALKATQQQLIQSEKMASLGELTAGIAHEIQNPLNFVNNFSDINTELIDELAEEVDKGNLNEVKAIAKDIKENEQKINHHGKRADAIVKGMLQHSRAGSGAKEPTDINALANEYFRLAYHGLRAKDKSFNVAMETDFDNTIPLVKIVPQDIGRVILNLITNAFYAVHEKKNTGIENYEPKVIVKTRLLKPPFHEGHSPKAEALGDLGTGAAGVEISIRDNGPGIPPHILDKIFQPFFTTKPTGQGTGLGLSLSYDLVKAHGGALTVETKLEEGTSFNILIPVHPVQ